MADDRDTDTDYMMEVVQLGGCLSCMSPLFFPIKSNGSLGQRYSSVVESIPYIREAFSENEKELCVYTCPYIHDTHRVYLPASF